VYPMRSDTAEKAMLMPPPLPPSPPEAPPAPSPQICITHCLYDEGLYRQAGFSVRACSTRDPLLLRFALEYPSYEIPKDVDKAALSREAAPRRLALVRIPGGKKALIHSAYVPGEECGRANNFFTHVLVRPALGPREAVAAWASPDWMTACPAGSDTDLPPFPGLPRPGPVSDAAVTAFLQPTAPTDGPDVATLTRPARLAGDAERRRELLCVALRGCLLALQAGPTSPRGRFFILAEPGLTALLLYGVVRLLPQALTADLTFSTYEHLHRDLRGFKHAQVVGTWTSDPTPGLAEGFFTVRGYALDTFNHKFSPELGADGDLPVEDWVALAAKGEWSAIDKVYRLLGKATTSVVSFKEGVEAARLSRRLAAGQAGPDDLLLLKRSAWGQPVLEQHRDRVWALVREASPADARLREACADVIKDHIPELEQRVALALAGPAPADWQPPWRLLCTALAEDVARLRDVLQRVLPEPPYPPGLRFALLHEVRQCQLSPLDPRLPLQRLLRSCAAEELDAFARADLPREWFALALCYALLKPESRAEASRRVHEADDTLVRAFGEQVKQVKDETHRRAILGPLFAADDPRGAVLVGRLLQHARGLRPETLAWVLETVGAWRREWREFWCRDNHLGNLLDVLREAGSEARPFWERLAGQLDAEVVLPGDSYQKVLLLDLAAARASAGDAFPPHAAQAVADWLLLRDHFEMASAVPAETRQAVLDACSRRRLDPTAALARYFDRFVRPQGFDELVLTDFLGFFHTFFPEPAEYPDYRKRALSWLRVVAVSPEEQQRADYRQYYLERCVPAEFHRRLLEEREHGAEALSASDAATGPGAPSVATAAPPARTLDDAAPFQLAGVAGSDAGTALPLRDVLARLPWLLCTVGGGMLAAFVTRLHLLPLHKVTGLVMFVPLVVAVAESMALQSAAVAGRALRRPGTSREALLRRLALELAAGALLGLVGGLVVTGTLLAVRWPVRMAVCVGGVVAGGTAGAAVVGVGLTFLACLLRRGPRVAAGPVARAVAGTGALLLYFTLARWLLG
jgi:hypothetical protein